MHVCTESPGEFKWQPGTLTQAVENGSWLILEDIDSAPLDVISVLIPLMESKSLVIPGMSKVIKAASGFQLFLTRRLVEEPFDLDYYIFYVIESFSPSHCCAIKLSI